MTVTDRAGSEAAPREVTGGATNLSPSRSFLHARLRTATLRHDADGQATLLNLLLRNYLHYNLYDQAEKLVSKSVFPEQANNNEWARYLYYTGERAAPAGSLASTSGHAGLEGPLVLITVPFPLSGRIKAIQLEYSEARRTMTNALRKAPQHTAVGFKQTVSGSDPHSPMAPRLSAQPRDRAAPRAMQRRQ